MGRALTIYIASSWRNTHYERIRDLLREAGHTVLDWREGGFSWSDIDPNWATWTPAQYREALKHPLAVKHFERDRRMMLGANACVLLLPAGRSASVEFGWFAEANRTVLHVPELPIGGAELMYAFADRVTITDEELLKALEVRR